MKRALVTGAADFTGSHLCERLLTQGDEVICADNFDSGTRRDIVLLLNHPNIEVVRYDVCFPLYVEVDRSSISPARRALLTARTIPSRPSRQACIA